MGQWCLPKLAKIMGAVKPWIMYLHAVLRQVQMYISKHCHLHQLTHMAMPIYIRFWSSYRQIRVDQQFTATAINDWYHKKWMLTEGSAKGIGWRGRRGWDSLNALEAGDMPCGQACHLWSLLIRQKMNYPIMHLQHNSLSVVRQYTERSRQCKMD